MSTTALDDALPHLRAWLAHRRPPNVDTAWMWLYGERWAHDLGIDFDGRHLRELLAGLVPLYRRIGDGDIEVFSVAHFLEYHEELEDGHDWLVPGLLAAGDRLIVTGRTGAGKSTLVGQLAVQMAAGVHPFTGVPIAPRRVLLVDAENPTSEMRARIANLVRVAGDRLDSSRLTVHSTDSRPLDLADTDVFDGIEGIVHELDADALVIGPLYKIRSGDPKDERSARLLSDNLDRLRSDYGCAVIVEAHPSKEGKSDVPAGAALWTQWPDVGLVLGAEGRLRFFRPPRRRQVEWPTRLVRGGEWPWSPRFDAPTTPTSDPVDIDSVVLDFLSRHRHEDFARTMLAAAMRAEGIKCRDESVRSAVERLADADLVTVVERGRSRRYSWKAEDCELI